MPTTLFSYEDKESDLMQQPGIGLSTPAAPQDEVQQHIAGLPTMQRIGARLEEFGAGYMGRPSPTRAKLDAQREQKTKSTDEARQFVMDLDNLAKLTDGMDETAKSGLVDTVAKRWGAIDKGYEAAVRSISARPSLLTDFDKYLPHLPVPVQQLAKRDPKSFLRFAGTSDGVKMLNQAADQPALQTASQKRDTVVMGWQKLVPPEKVKEFEADGVITDSEILEMQQHLPDQLRFSADERAAIQRSPVFWEGTGVLHGDKAQEVLAHRAKEASKKDDKAPTVKEISGTQYAYDPDGKLKGKRLGTDDRWVELGPKKAPGDDGPSWEDIIKVELQTSDDYRQDSKKFTDRRPLFESSTNYMAQRAKGGKTSAGDAALLFSYAKMRDPNDRIAVNDIRDLHKLGNIFERFGVSVEAVLDKGQTLPDRVAKDMFSEIRRSFTTLNSAQKKLEDRYRKKVTDYKGKPERVIGEGLALPEEMLKGGKDGKPQDAPKKGDIVDRGGKRWKVIGHDKDGEPLVEEVRGRST